MAKPITLLQINTVAHGVTPVASIMRTIHEAALDAGIDAHMVAGYGDPTDCDLVMEGRAGRYLSALSARLRGNDGFAARTPTRRLLKHIDRLQPHIVHLHNAHGYYLNLPMLKEFLRIRGIPLVVTLHDHWWLTGRCATPRATGCTRHLTHECDHCPHPDIYPAAWFPTPAHYKDSRDVTFVAPSAQLAGSVGAVVIPNGVDIPRPPRTPDVRPFALAVAARWTLGKDPLTLLRLAPLLGMPLVIVGRLQGGIAPDTAITTVNDPQLLATALSSAPCGAFNIPGPVDKDALARLYADAAVLISTSRSEAYGMTVAEALLCGTPAVVRASTAPAELLTADDGLAVPFTDLDDAAAAIRRAATTLRPTATRIIPPSAMAAAYLDLYRRLALTPR